MIDELREEIASLYALDLLDGTERTQFESAMTADAALQTLVRDFRNAAAALAFAAPATPPPAELKERVLSSIEEHAESGPAAPGHVVRPPPSVFRTFLPWFAAAGFAVGAGWLATLYSLSRTELSLARTQENLVSLALKSAANQLEAERILTGRQVAELNQQLMAQGDLAHFKITTLASLLNNSPQALAVAIWDPAKQEGVLQVEKLPALAANQDYQIWVVDPQYPIPVDGGVFSVNPAGGARVAFKSKQPVNVINAFAVTLERKGGVPKAEGPFVLLGK
ncbi:MAG: anti-sigma factor [Opitutus sp.]|nr:anti-sigma factor [Opitutus sp.]